VAAKRPGVKLVLQLALSVVYVIVAVSLFAQREAIADHVTVWKYEPPAEITALADKTTMTDGGRWYFYASEPSLEERETFNQHCTNQSEETIILGCYATERNLIYAFKRIYIYNVDDKRLPFVEEVTAAHEMLHAAYERLSSSERERVDSLVEQAINNNSDEHIAQMNELYRAREPDRLYNEMHSILGTEAGKLPAELEKHYARYFANRSEVVKMARQYTGVFNELRDKQQRLNRELDEISRQIDTRGAVYDGAVKTFEDKVRIFNNKANSGGFTTQEEYDRERGALVADQQRLEAERDAINALVAAHNRKRKELQALLIETDKLNESIDSRVPAESPEL
jgi:hypothetical protein